MQTGHGFRQSFIVTRQSAKTRYPAEASFDHPSPRQQHKASFRRWEFDNFELDPMFFRRIGCVFACVALINIGDLDCFAGLGLHSLGKFGDPGRGPAHRLLLRATQENLPRCQPPNELCCLCGVSPRRSRRDSRSRPPIASYDYRRSRPSAVPSGLRRFTALRAGRGRVIQKL
jgi:hypothetical protein